MQTNKILIDTKDAISSLDEVLKKIGSVEKDLNKLSDIEVDPNIKLDEIEVEDIDVKINVDKTELDNASKEISNISDPSVKINVGDADLDKAIKKVDELDSEKVDIQLNVEETGLNEQLTSITKKITEVFSKIDLSSASSAGGSLGTLFSGTLGGVAGGAGISAIIEGFKAISDAIGDAYEKGIQFNNSIKDLSNITGATGKEFENLRDSAEKLFLSGFGESVSEANKAVGDLYVKLKDTFKPDEYAPFLVQMNQISKNFDVEIGESINKSSNFIKAFGLEAQQSIELVNYVMKNAKNGQDDVLDTLSEYSTLFKQAGYSAEEFVNILNNGVNNGAMNTDFIADAIKEFDIRIKDSSAIENFEKLPLNISDNVKKGLDDILKLGSDGLVSSKKTIEDYTNTLKISVEQGKISQEDAQKALVAAFGTKAEDLGFNTVVSTFSIKTDEEAIKQEAEKAGELLKNQLGQYDTFSQMWRKFQLAYEKAIGGFVEFINNTIGPIFSYMFAQLEKVWGPIINGISDYVKTLSEQFNEANSSVNIFSSIINILFDSLSSLYDIIGTVVNIFVNSFILTIKTSQTIIQFLIDVIIGLVKGFYKLIDSIPIVSNILNALIGAAKDTYSWFSNLISNIGSFGTIINGIKGTIEAFLSQIKALGKAISELDFGKIKDSIKNIFSEKTYVEGYENGIKKIANDKELEKQTKLKAEAIKKEFSSISNVLDEIGTNFSNKTISKDEALKKIQYLKNIANEALKSNAITRQQYDATISQISSREASISKITNKKIVDNNKETKEKQTKINNDYLNEYEKAYTDASNSLNQLSKKQYEIDVKNSEKYFQDKIKEANLISDIYKKTEQLNLIYQEQYEYKLKNIGIEEANKKSLEEQLKIQAQKNAITTSEYINTEKQIKELNDKFKSDTNVTLEESTAYFKAIEVLEKKKVTLIATEENILNEKLLAINEEFVTNKTNNEKNKTDYITNYNLKEEEKLLKQKEELNKYSLKTIYENALSSINDINITDAFNKKIIDNEEIINASTERIDAIKNEIIENKKAFASGEIDYKEYINNLNALDEERVDLLKEISNLEDPWAVLISGFSDVFAQMAEQTEKFAQEAISAFENYNKSIEQSKEDSSKYQREIDIATYEGNIENIEKYTKLKLESDEKLKFSTEGSSAAIQSAYANLAVSVGETLASLALDSKLTFKSLISTSLDALDALVPILVAQITGYSLATAQSVATAGIAGIAQAAALTILLKAAVAVAKAAVVGKFEKGGLAPSTGISGLQDSSKKFIEINETGEPEFIVNARSTKKFMPILEKINNTNIKNDNKSLFNEIFDVDIKVLDKNNEQIINELKNVNSRLQTIESVFSNNKTSTQNIDINFNKMKLSGNDLFASFKRTSSKNFKGGY